VWEGAVTESDVATIRTEIDALLARGVLSQANHSQRSATRDDNVAFLSLRGGLAAAPSGGEDDSFDGDEDGDYEEGMAWGERCPPASRKAFALMERVASQLSGVLSGTGPVDGNDKTDGSLPSAAVVGHKRLPCLLVPPVGMAAVYDGTASRPAKYVAHKDNELLSADVAAAGTAAGREVGLLHNWRNYRVLTVILYLNKPDWNVDEHGGTLNVFPGGASADAVEIAPTGGSLVMFDSRYLLHEVRPCTKRRYALTCWFVSAACVGIEV
jgi:hypothetical protein